MNTHIVIGAIVLVLVGGGAWYLLSGDKAVAPSETAEKRETGTAREVEATKSAAIEEAFSGTGSFMELMGMGRNLICEFSYVSDEGDGAVAGTVKVAGEKIRGDFEMQQADGVINSHLIQDSEYAYTWSETPDGTFAIKSPIKDENAEAGVDVGQAMFEADMESDRAVDMDNDVDYDCRPWTPDGSVFVPPSNVEFMDPEAMMKEMMQGFDPSLLPQ